jgi:hypothetical protein
VYLPAKNKKMKKLFKRDAYGGFSITKQKKLLTRQQLRQPCNVCEMPLSKDSESRQAATQAALWIWSFIHIHNKSEFKFKHDKASDDEGMF